jgi:23S rRNA (uracil1939-C5)-methyltransferase
MASPLRRPERRPSPRPAIESRSAELTIDYMAAGGDGAARLPDAQTVFMPFTLPGETVRAMLTGQSRATLETILTASPQRIKPPCPHFGACGGCALQHWDDSSYAAWKQDLLRRALEKAGFSNPATAPLQRTPPAARRRMEFAARRVADGVTLGLHAAHTQTIVPIDGCTVLHPALERLLAPLRTLLGSLNGLKRSADIAANLLDNGVDLLIRADAEANAIDRKRLAAFAAAQNIARIAWSIGPGTPENAALLRLPEITFAGARVNPPPAAFLQASAQGEAAIVAAVLAALPEKLPAKARIIELYAGIGTLSFPLATRARVQAYEGDRPAAEALRRAAGGTRVEAMQRDLTRQPLQAKELAGASAVVLDPPFAGIGAQLPTLAAARVPVVVLVSCNPVALAREAAVLREAGYALISATPIDQFVWSAQLEAVCVFQLKAKAN